jgi:hypothetical protein
LIGWVAAFLLLSSAQSFQPTPKLHRAKPEDVPLWAQQGNFRFIRLDGGQIESWKAERTWWGKKFSTEEKEVLTHIYDRDFDLMLSLLKQAEFNWIWVTWSNGWSLKDEDENRENLKKVITRCHENGIHVSAYLSASNMFPKSAYRDDPETKQYGLWMHGVPTFYAGPTVTDLHISWHRRLADARYPGWRAYLLKKAALAVDAGVDAIIWDNMIGYNDGLAQLLDDTQRMAELKARGTGRPKVMVYANIHISPGRFGMNDLNEAIWEEDGKDTPGVWHGRWQVDNARKIKFLSGEKQLWQPLMYENDLYHCGPRECCIPSPAEQKLSIAEAYAFGAAHVAQHRGPVPVRANQAQAGGPGGMGGHCSIQPFPGRASGAVSPSGADGADRLDLRGAAESAGRRIPKAERLLRNQSARAPGQGSALGSVQGAGGSA